MNPTLSIVIPVYNVSPYVEKCIRSCYNQAIEPSLLEVILVNDGSTDNSLEICKKLKLEFTSLKIVNQKNKGLSGARNTGLKHASGDYIWFVDSDDWIQENCLVSIIQNIEKFHMDILWIGHDVIYNGASTKEFIPEKTFEPVSGDTFFETYLNNLFYIWKFIYRRGFLLENKLWFYEGILYEDLEFTPRALLKAKTCITLPNVYYHYLMREGSIVNNIKDKNIEDRFVILHNLFKLSKNNTVPRTYQKKLMDIITHIFVGTVKMSAKANLMLPQSAFDLLKQMKNEKFAAPKNKFDYILIKFNLSAYQKIYATTYSIYKFL